MSEGRIVAASRATHVTFYEDRARVVRAATAVVGHGIVRVRVSGISAFVDERSVEARVTSGEAKVLSLSAHWFARSEGVATPKDVEALEARRLEAERAVALAERALERATASRARIAAIALEEAGALAEVPSGTRDATVFAAHAGAWAALGTAESEALTTADRIRREIAPLRDALELADARLSEARTQEPRLEAALEVQIEAARREEIGIELTYRLPCALWRPEHLARLVTNGDGAEGGGGGKHGALEIVTLATMWQRTGEEWENVEVELSTARPAREAEPPLLVEDVLRTRKKAPELRRRVVLQSREETVKTAGLARGDQHVAEMPGVYDGGEPLHYTPTSKVTLRSDGRPVRVEIARAALDTVVSRVVYAELSAAAHLRATSTLAKGGPLLAGPLRVAHNATMVGRSKIDFVGKGEPFEIGFGPDDAVRVRRRTRVEHDTSALTGARKIRHHVTLFFANLSDLPRSLEVVERVPVSEVEGLEVDLGDDEEGTPSRDAWKLDPKTGFATAYLTLGARATAVLRFAYELCASANVVLEG